MSARSQDYNIHEGSKVHLVLRLRGGMFHQTSGREGAFDPVTGHRVVKILLPNGDQIEVPVGEEDTFEVGVKALLIIPDALWDPHISLMLFDPSFGIAQDLCILYTPTYHLTPNPYSQTFKARLKSMALPPSA